MKGYQVWEYDENGFFVRVHFIKGNKKVPEKSTSVSPPDGLFRAKWDGMKWIEDMTQEEIDAIWASEPVPAPTNEQLKQENETLKNRLTNTETSLVSVMDVIAKGGV